MHCTKIFSGADHVSSCKRFHRLLKKFLTFFCFWRKKYCYCESTRFDEWRWYVHKCHQDLFSAIICIYTQMYMYMNMYIYIYIYIYNIYIYVYIYIYISKVVYFLYLQLLNLAVLWHFQFVRDSKINFKKYFIFYLNALLNHYNRNQQLKIHFIYPEALLQLIYCSRFEDYFEKRRKKFERRKWW